VKYGLYAAVLAGLVSGTVAWTSVDKTVTLVVDGQPATLHTTAASVGAVLAGAGYSAGPHDILAPAASASIGDGGRIVLARGRLLHLTVDGVERDVWTTAPTVAAALAQLGYSTTDFTSVSRAKRLPLSPTDIDVRTPKVVTVVAGGRTTKVTTTDRTVGALLADLGISVDPDDRLTPSAATAVRDGLKVVVNRVSKRTVTTAVSLPFATKTEHDANRPAGQTRVLRAGKTGLTQVTWALVYVDGKLAGRTKIRTVTLRAPVTKVVSVGTQQAPVVTTARTYSAPAPSPGSAQAIAKQLLAARGWGDGQFDCLVQIWDRESGWNVHAANPSGAYGIPQALPGSKMGSAGPDWQDDATTQIRWGLGYIAGRYGTPCGAWSFWQNNGWY
jgi:uncharacterized protein YabE (DUF348 family)